MKKTPKQPLTVLLCITLLLMYANGVSQTPDRLHKEHSRTAAANQTSLQLKNELLEKHGYHRPPNPALARPVTVTTPGYPPVNTADSLALVALYNSTDGPNWNNRTNWLAGPVYSWYGILVIGDRVTGLTLYNNNLNGTIPSEIGVMTALQTLVLEQNHLSGSIPSSLGGCAALVYLDLYDNELTGSIPSQLGNLTNLAVLYLDDNYLTGSIPGSLGGLLNLRELDLSFNYLQGPIPSALGTLPNLAYLSLWVNELSGAIPASLGDISSLEWLDLEDNNLTGSIPGNLGKLASLWVLSLADNSLTGDIPAELSALADLEVFWMGENHLTGTIPSFLGNLSYLWIVGLSKNRLTGTIPSALGDVASLDDLLVDGNSLEGPVPAALTNLSLYPGGSDFRYNKLYSDDPAVISYLNTVQDGGDWQSTQTVPPAALNCQNQSGTSVQLWWPTIAYAGDTGGYLVSYATNPAGPYTLFGSTPDKAQGGQLVTGLEQGVQYWFRVKTQTNPHSANENTLISGESPLTTITVGWNLPEISVRAGGALENGSTLDLGRTDITWPKERIITITNAGRADLTLTLPLSINGTDAANFTLVSGPDKSVLPPGDSTTALLRFLSADPGKKEAALTILSDDGDENPFTVPLKAEANRHTLSISHEPAAGGSTDPAEGTYEYDHNDIVDLDAVAAPGWDFLRWEGNGIDDPALSSVSVTMDTSYQRTAIFGRTGSSRGPFLSYLFPVDSAASVPLNASIQFMAADSGDGVDLAALNCWINDIQVVSGGIPETDSTVVITEAGPHYRVVISPADDFPQDSTVSVRVQFSEIGHPESVCDSSWTFFTGTAILDTTTVNSYSAGPEGGTITHDSLGVRIALPANALVDTVEISIGLAGNLPPLPEGYRGIGLDYYFGPDGLAFAHDIMVAVPYTQEDLDAAGVASALDLIVNYYHTAEGEWRELTVDHVDETAQLLYVSMNEFCFLTFATAATAVEEQRTDQQPKTWLLEPPYPNPFNPETRIRYHVPARGQVELTVFDLLGRHIRTLVDGTQAAGTHAAWWDGRDSSGRKAASGTYLIILKSGEQREMQKAVLLQ
ncbi:T9SS type A sorting domain-containing protein [bacterium]|nr:T9SS type A sorting domain-containing protein [bacterium]